MSSKNETPEELLEHRAPLGALEAAQEPKVRLRVEVDKTNLVFAYALGAEAAERHPGGAGWTQIGPELDATILADEFSDQGAGAFSGAFVGICAQDLRDKQSWAEFGYFEYSGA
jgi:xylan 1,4-beta-xylosidase